MGVTTLMDPVGKLLASFDILLAYSTCGAFSFLNAFPFSLKLLSLQCKKRLASLMSSSVKAIFCAMFNTLFDTVTLSVQKYTWIRGALTSAKINAFLACKPTINGFQNPNACAPH